MKYEIRSSSDRKPVVVGHRYQADRLVELVKARFGRDVTITETPGDAEDAYTDAQMSVDIVILGLDLANREAADLSSIVGPVVDANSALAEQYVGGNEKALNAIMGKFMRENKGYDPAVVKDAIVTYIMEKRN